MSEKAKHIEALKKDIKIIETVPEEYLSDKDIIKSAFDREWYEYIDFINGYPDIFRGLKYFELVDATLSYDKDFVKELIPLCSGYLFSYLPKKLREDKEIFLLSLSHVGADYVFSKLIDNCEEDGKEWDENELLNLELDLRCEIEKKSITEYAGENLLKDIEVVYKVLDIEPDSFCFVNNSLFENRELAIKAVSKGCFNYQKLSNDLKNDKEIIKIALEGKGLDAGLSTKVFWENLEYHVIKYIPEPILNDTAFCLEIIRNTKNEKDSTEYFIQFASDRIRNDRNINLEIVKKNWEVLEVISKEFINDKEIILEALKQNSFAIKYASSEIKNAKDFIFDFIKKSPQALQYVSDNLKDNKEFVLEIVKINGNVLQYASERLKNDSQVISACNIINENRFLQ